MVFEIPYNSIITTTPIIYHHPFQQRRLFSRRRSRRRHHLPIIEDIKSSNNDEATTSVNDKGKQQTHRPGEPIPNPEWYVEDDYNYPKTFHGWIIHIKEAAIMYGRTWEGFFDRNQKKETWEEFEERILKERGMIQKKDNPTDVDDDDEEVEKKLSTLERQVDDNIDELRHNRDKLVNYAKERTGISDKEALKLWMEDQLRLANECVSEFMAGYREGRDKEIDAMLNDYFKDFDKENDDKDEGEKEEDEEEEEQRRERRLKRQRRRKALLQRI